jgi:hypothetical protein
VIYAGSFGGGIDTGWEKVSGLFKASFPDLVLET